MSSNLGLKGQRFILREEDELFPQNLRDIPNPPACLYGIGDIKALKAGLAIIGARKATPYGLNCAARFSRMAAEKGVCIISGGARGCDGEAHRAALDANGTTVVFLGGGCDRIYPAAHRNLFQEIIDKGGAVVSEQPWEVSPKPYMFRERNRLIAGLANVVLIVEAGLPSGTFSTADEALNAGREVLVIPGAISSPTSRGSNRLLYQGAIPIVDDESFEEVLFSMFGILQVEPKEDQRTILMTNPLLAAIAAEPLDVEAIYNLAIDIYGKEEARIKMNEMLIEGESLGLIARQPSGLWGPTIKR